MSEEKQSIYMRIQLDQSYNLTRWLIDLVAWDRDTEEPRGLHWTDLDSLVVRAWFWEKKALEQEPEKRSDPCHGGNVEFHGDFDLWQLPKIAKRGSAILRELNKLEVKYGRARTFAEYVMRVADVLKVKGFVLRREKQRDHQISIWQLVDASSARAHIEFTNFKYVKALFPEHEKTEESAA